MTVRSLVQIFNPDASSPASVGLGTILRESSRNIRADADPGVLGQVLQDMVDTMIAHPVCIGLSAVQIGLPFSIALVCLSRDPQKDLHVLINPVIEGSSGQKDRKYESCMSVPGYRGQVETRDKIACAYRDENMIKRRHTYSGFLARAIRHEIDHCEGQLFTQHVRGGDQLEATDIFGYEPPVSDPYEKGDIELLTEYLCESSM
jgi:peptide deformylase